MFITLVFPCCISTGSFRRYLAHIFDGAFEAFDLGRKFTDITLSLEDDVLVSTLLPKLPGTIHDEEFWGVS